MVPDKQGLRDETLTLISAGNGNTGIPNTVTLLYIVYNQEIQDRLLAQLKTVMLRPDSHVNYSKLEQLPYLTEVIKKGLRYSSPADSRTPRLVLPRGVHLPDSRFIPEGDSRVNGNLPHPLQRDTL
ncbi:cytochrome P450 [Talaromyces proteolyticus]|uniref:Cytochrome P450 n=1 Tax=Talaromyces proteolyticus TaxID=1131652 RepID=A0AAD4Q1C7_9EURO|nr:cytochrome P450 [Talaromyces proteolyticus]KAH8698355.1 cytochrome P450 [Talaromyces proteolyticus]